MIKIRIKVMLSFFGLILILPLSGCKKALDIRSYSIPPEKIKTVNDFLLEMRSQVQAPVSSQDNHFSGDGHDHDDHEGHDHD